MHCPPSCVPGLVGRTPRRGHTAGRYEASLSIPYSTRDLIFWVAVQILLVHWYACLWNMIASLGDPREGLPNGLEEALEQRMLADPDGCTGCITTGELARTSRIYCLDTCVPAACRRGLDHTPERAGSSQAHTRERARPHIRGARSHHSP